MIITLYIIVSAQYWLSTGSVISLCFENLIHETFLKISIQPAAISNFETRETVLTVKYLIWIVSHKDFDLYYLFIILG